MGCAKGRIVALVAILGLLAAVPAVRAADLTLTYKLDDTPRPGLVVLVVSLGGLLPEMTDAEGTAVYSQVSGGLFLAVTTLVISGETELNVSGLRSGAPLLGLGLLYQTGSTLQPKLLGLDGATFSLIDGRAYVFVLGWMQ